MNDAVTWITRQQADSWEEDAARTLRHELHDELEALDRLVELFVPTGLTIPAALNDAQVVALLGLESSLYQDVRAFRHLIARGYMPEGLQIARAIYLALWKARAASDDAAFARRVAADERIPDAEVRRVFAHVRALAERPGDWDYESETLAEIEEEYETLSKIVHKRKGGSEFQARTDESGNATIFRDPPGVLVEGYGAALVLKIAVEVANGLRQIVPFILERAGAGRTEWTDRWNPVAEYMDRLMTEKWNDRKEPLPG